MDNEKLWKYPHAGPLAPYGNTTFLAVLRQSSLPPCIGLADSSDIYHPILSCVPMPFPRHPPSANGGSRFRDVPVWIPSDDLDECIQFRHTRRVLSGKYSSLVFRAGAVAVATCAAVFPKLSSGAAYVFQQRVPYIRDRVLGPLRRD